MDYDLVKRWMDDIVAAKERLGRLERLGGGPELAEQNDRKEVHVHRGLKAMANAACSIMHTARRHDQEYPFEYSFGYRGYTFLEIAESEEDFERKERKAEQGMDDETAAKELEAARRDWVRERCEDPVQGLRLSELLKAMDPSTFFRVRFVAYGTWTVTDRHTAEHFRNRAEGLLGRTVESVRVKDGEIVVSLDREDGEE